MAPTISKETAKTLADTVQMCRRIQDSNKKIQDRYKRMYEGLRAGLDHASEDEIELYRPQLAKVGEEIDDTLNSIQGALGLLSQLRADEDLMELKFDQIEQLVKSVAGTRKRLSEQAAAARKLDAEAEKGLAGAKKSELSAEADLGALQAQVKGLMKAIEHVDKEAPKLEAAARKAHGAGDQKTLTDSRVKLIEFQKLGTAAKSMRPRIEKYKKQYPDLDRDRKAEVQWLLDDIQRAEDSIGRVERLVKELVALGQVRKEPKPAELAKEPTFSKTEVAKSAEALGMKPKDVPKLTRVLNEMPRSKWVAELEKLANSLGLEETDGKKLVAKLNKLPFVRQKMLIDI